MFDGFPFIRSFFTFQRLVRIRCWMTQNYFTIEAISNVSVEEVKTIGQCLQMPTIDCHRYNCEHR